MASPPDSDLDKPGRISLLKERFEKLFSGSDPVSENIQSNNETIPTSKVQRLNFSLNGILCN